MQQTMITRSKGNGVLTSTPKCIKIGNKTYHFPTKSSEEFNFLMKLLSGDNVNVVIGGEGLVKGATISYLVRAI